MTNPDHSERQSPYEFNHPDRCCEFPEHGKHFTSPNSRLPQEQLDALQRCIEEANDLLRSLGNEPNPENTRQLQLHFLQMRGLTISLTLTQEDYTLGGKVITAGRDFIQIEDNVKMFFIRYDKILSIERKKAFLHLDEQELLCINPDIRKELVQNFGEFVSSRTDLVNLFFGTFLYRHLYNDKGKNLSVRMISSQIVESQLVEADENGLTVKVDEEMKLPFEEILLIEIC